MSEANDSRVIKYLTYQPVKFKLSDGTIKTAVNFGVEKENPRVFSQFPKFVGRVLSSTLGIAQEFAANGGIIFSVPQAIQYSLDKGDFDILSPLGYCTLNTQEYFLVTPNGNKVVVVSHGGDELIHKKNYFSFMPEKKGESNGDAIEERYYPSRLSPAEVHSILYDSPNYYLSEFKNKTDFPEKFNLILDYEDAKNSAKLIDFSNLDHYGIITDKLMKNPLYLARVGGLKSIEKVKLQILKSFENNYVTSETIYNDHFLNRWDRDESIGYYLEFNSCGAGKQISPAALNLHYFVAAGPSAFGYKENPLEIIVNSAISEKRAFMHYKSGLLCSPYKEEK